MPAVSFSHTIISPVRLAPMVDVDWIARATYMQNYYVRMKAQRLRNRAHAKLATRRSPRLATTST